MFLLIQQQFARRTLFARPRAKGKANSRCYGIERLEERMALSVSAWLLEPFENLENPSRLDLSLQQPSSQQSTSAEFGRSDWMNSGEQHPNLLSSILSGRPTNLLSNANPIPSLLAPDASSTITSVLDLAKPLLPQQPVLNWTDDALEQLTLRQDQAPTTTSRSELVGTQILQGVVRDVGRLIDTTAAELTDLVLGDDRALESVMSHVRRGQESLLNTANRLINETVIQETVPSDVRDVLADVVKLPDPEKVLPGIIGEGGLVELLLPPGGSDDPGRNDDEPDGGDETSDEGRIGGPSDGVPNPTVPATRPAIVDRLFEEEQLGENRPSQPDERTQPGSNVDGGTVQLAALGPIFNFGAGGQFGLANTDEAEMDEAEAGDAATDLLPVPPSRIDMGVGFWRSFQLGDAGVAPGDREAPSGEAGPSGQDIIPDLVEMDEEAKRSGSNLSEGGMLQATISPAILLAGIAAWWYRRRQAARRRKPEATPENPGS